MGHAIVRRIYVATSRLNDWVSRFEDRHGESTLRFTPRTMTLTCPDGAHAWITTPWTEEAASTIAGFIALSHPPRRLGILVARARASAVGVAVDGHLAAHRVTTSYVQGRTKKGGWSQGRYARRRANQASKSYERASRDVIEVIGPHRIDALLIGGDKAALREILADPRLAGWAGLADQVTLDLPQPRLAALNRALELADSVSIGLDLAATHKGGTIAA